MSTMLATTNPEAAGEADPARDRRVPYVGQVVVYHCRPGEGRQGKLSAPALVTKIEDEDHIEVLISFAADDFISRWKVARKSEQNPINSWSFNEYDEEHYQPGGVVKLPVMTEDGQMTWEDVKQMYKEIGVLRADVKALAIDIANLRNDLEGKAAKTVVLPKTRGKA